MAKCQDISADLARQLFDYDPKTGILRWKPRMPDMFEPTPKQTALHRCKNWNVRFAGKMAGCPDGQGYLRVAIFNKFYRVQRIAWAIMTGEWPPFDVDHENGIRVDNRWKNIRKATRRQNCQNLSQKPRHGSPYVGVTWKSRIGKWAARITNDYKEIYLGVFDTPEAAHEAYKAAKARLHTFQPTLRD